MPRSWTAPILTVPLAASLVLSACSVNHPAETPPGETVGTWDATAARGAITALPASQLADFTSCSDLLTYYQANALELVTPYGIGGWSGGMAGEDIASAAGDAAREGGTAGLNAPAAGDGQSSGEGTGHSATNVQEEGVDEPDIVKTNGSIIIAVTNGSVRVVDVETRTVLSTITLPGRRDQAQPSEVLLHGDTLVVLSQEWSFAQPRDGRQLAFHPGRTIVTTVDLSDPASPTTIGSVRIEGSYRSARLVGDTVRMVMVTEPPGVLTTQPTSGSLSAEDDAERANADLVRATTIDDWIPHRQALDADGRVLSTEPLLDCDQISRPRDPAGLSTMSILTFDIGSADPEPTSGAGLVASGSTVYASSDRLVVATSGWDLWGAMPSLRESSDAIWPGGRPANRSDLHSFDISDPAATRYVASGTVEGRLINQWALDEDDGVIRVATTTDAPGASQQSQSSLTVLREDGDQLAQVGKVDGLGPDEQIQSVRYLSEDLAAVVTFRQTDPLYLIDTSDPTAPTVAGELKIPGYSAYLHPIGDGWLLGVGQDADVDTGQSKGLQASLFDIRDLRNPRQAKVLTWGSNAYSPVESDHRAFLYWAGTDQVVIPYTQWSEGKSGEMGETFAGVTTLGVGPDRLVEQGRTSTSPKGQGWGEAPLRTMVIGDDLWTLDWQGLARFDLATLEGGWAVDLP